MTWRTASATAVRVLRQLRRDPRTVALLLVVPSALLTLVRYSFADRPMVFQRIGLPLIGVFPLVSMFLVASIAMLRERRSGTLERLMSLPTTKLGLLIGYAAAFAVIACVQAVATLLVGVGLLGLDVTGPLWLAVVVSIANATLGMAMGLSLSTFARTEFQAIQFMPAFVLPQFLLCGLLADRAEMARPLELLSNILPLTYAYDALRSVADRPGVSSGVVTDLCISVGMTLLALTAGAVTLRQEDTVNDGTDAGRVLLDGVSKTYERGAAPVHALSDVSLDIGAGQFVVLLGPSGSGKTTLLNLIGAIEPPDAGSVRVSGVDVTRLTGRELDRYRRDVVGFVFQFFNLVPTLTAVENVEVIAELTGSGAADRAAEVLRDVGLATEADQFPGQLSGGEQQRVAIARALVKHAPVVLADEPTGSLDLETGRHVLALLRSAADRGSTVVLVTHNTAIADLADRIIHLRDGRIASDDRHRTPIAATEVTW